MPRPLRPIRALVAVLSAAALAASAVSAQTASAASAQPDASAQLRIERGPYFVGEPVEVHVQITGFSKSPEPRCSADAPPHTTLTLAGIVPTVSSSVQIVGGQVTRTESVTFVCQYVLVASRPGPVRLEPFEATQAGTVVRTTAYAIDVEEIPLDPRVRVDVRMPEGPVYIGQQIPVRIEWWLDASLTDRIRAYAVRSPLFEAPDVFRFVSDEIAMRGDQSLEISTAEGELALRADIQEREEDGRRFLVVAAERSMVALRAGHYDLAPATVNVDEVTRWQRDLFGSRRPAGTRRLFARDEPLSFTVETAPTEGRPPSFGGAIGKGFSLEVRADRSVVQRGDPITLTLTVRGDGQLATVGLPPLDGPGGLAPEHFRVLDEELSGEVEDGAKTFEVPVRVLDERVREIPAIEYAWFDPDLGAYQTTRSRPIALSVRPAEVISAEDVVAATPAGGAETRREAETGGEAARAAATERGHEVPGVGADLAIEQGLARLVAHPAPTIPLRLSLYGGGLALCAGALLWRRRERTPPRVAKLRALRRETRARIAAAADRPGREALAEIAVALRALTNADEALRSRPVEAFLRECDDLLYAPAPVGDDDAAARVARALALVDDLEASIR